MRSLFAARDHTQLRQGLPPVHLGIPFSRPSIPSSTSSAAPCPLAYWPDGDFFPVGPWRMIALISLQRSRLFSGRGQTFRCYHKSIRSGPACDSVGMCGMGVTLGVADFPFAQTPLRTGLMR